MFCFPNVFYFQTIQFKHCCDFYLNKELPNSNFSTLHFPLLSFLLLSFLPSSATFSPFYSSIQLSLEYLLNTLLFTGTVLVTRDKEMSNHIFSLRIPQPHLYLVLSVFLVLAILVAVKYYPLLVLIYTFLMINGVEYLFLYSLAIHILISYFVKCLALWLFFLDFCLYYYIVGILSSEYKSFFRYMP